VEAGLLFKLTSCSDEWVLVRPISPRILSGIGNAYSDEILHTAQLSPILQTHKLTRRNGSDCSRQPVKHCNSGSTGLKRKPIRAFQRKLRPFGKTWLYTDALSNPVHDAASRYSEFVMPTMKRTTALSVRPEAKCWQTEACPGSLERTGLELWMNWKP